MPEQREEQRPTPEQREKQREYQRERWASMTPEQRERRRDRRRKQQATPAQREQARRRSRENALRRNYNITLADKQALLAMQGGRCACCGGCDPRTKHGWHTDHEHESKFVRGILCNACNVGIGHLGDRLPVVRERCAQVIAYLEEAERRRLATYSNGVFRLRTMMGPW